MILTLALPVMAVLSVIVLMDSGRPILFCQQRVGRYGRLFKMYKFRTMTAGSSGPQITAVDDHRITRSGKWLRRLKLDELPEFFNVLRGDMAIVGPRPEVPRFVDYADASWIQALSVRPGITDPVSLENWNEAISPFPDSGNVESHYATHLLPRKLSAQLAYLKYRTWRSDLVVIWRTMKRFTCSGFQANTRESRTRFEQ